MEKHTFKTTAYESEMLYSCIKYGGPHADPDIKSQTSYQVVGALDHVALNENRNAVFIWSAAMCLIFVAPINVILMRPL